MFLTNAPSTVTLLPVVTCVFNVFTLDCKFRFVVLILLISVCARAIEVLLRLNALWKSSNCCVTSYNCAPFTASVEEADNSPAATFVIFVPVPKGPSNVIVPAVASSYTTKLASEEGETLRNRGADTVPLSVEPVVGVSVLLFVSPEVANGVTDNVRSPEPIINFGDTD